MPRLPRQAFIGLPHHITHRGNHQQTIFSTDDDRRIYLSMLKEKGKKYGLILLGYCLMDNHVHLIGVPAEKDSMALAIGRTHWAYTQLQNKMNAQCGHLWQNRYYSCPLDDSYLLRAMAYIELNPVRAALIRNAWDYPWSSARQHVEENDPSGFIDLQLWKRWTNFSSWRNILTAESDVSFGPLLAAHSRRGIPLGIEAFVTKLEVTVGRGLRLSGRGRPWKNAKEPTAK